MKANNNLPFFMKGEIVFNMKKGNNFELRDGVSDAFLPFWEMFIV